MTCGSQIRIRLVVSLYDSGEKSMSDEEDALTSDQSVGYGRRLLCHPSSQEKVGV